MNQQHVHCNSRVNRARGAFNIKNVHFVFSLWMNANVGKDKKKKNEMK